MVKSVPDAVQQFSGQFGLYPFNGQSDTFTAVGGHDGMLIVVPVGRGWFPVGRPAVSAPFRVKFEDESGVFELDDTLQVRCLGESPAKFAKR